MPSLIRKYKSRSYREVEWAMRLRERLSEDLIAQRLEQLRRERNEQKRERASKRAQRLAWGEIIPALQHERRIVRSMTRYKTATPAPERDEFVQAYNEALKKVYEKLIALRDAGSMPEHTHWTDFVPPKIKHAFVASFADIPPRAKAKIKIPFERVDTLALHDRRKARLLRRTLTERDTAEISGDTDKKEKIEEAIRRIRAMPRNAHVPNTWHGMFSEGEGDGW